MLSCIPTTEHLSRLYFELNAIGADCAGEKRPWPYHPHTHEELFCLAADMSRYDPRMITILTRYLDAHWEAMNPSKVRSFYKEMTTPQGVAVIAEFVLSASEAGEKSLFCEYLQRGLYPVPVQYYFHHIYSPGGNLAQKAASQPLAEYKKWGFLACEAPVIDAKKRTALGTLDAAARRNVLFDLMKERGSIRLSDYLDALGHRISRQQALGDLKSAPWTRRRGKGRGARWFFAA